MDFFVGLGYFGLFLGSFLAGSIVPFSSEIMLTAMLASGFNPIICLVATTLGNTAGGMTCYYLGRLGKIETLQKWFHIKEESIMKYHKKVEGKGQWMALFAWLPYAGEAISVALGFTRSRAAWVCFYMAIGKLGRYLVVLLIIMGVIEKLF